MNKFDIKANQIEKTFFRKIKSGSFFFTGKGNENVIEKVTNKTVFIKSKIGNSSNGLSRAKLKEAIAFMLYKRTATRKDLESYSNFNSALMGLLRMVLIEIAKIHKTVNGLLRITIRGVRFFFSGLDRPMKMDFDAIIKNNANFILNSYFYLRQRKNCDDWMEKLRENELKLLLDSGEFSLFNAKEKGKDVEPITVEAYANFINRHKDSIYAYFNLDVIGNAQKSKENYAQLRELTGISPIPVWHCNPDNWRDSDWRALEEMVNEDHEIIALGATVMLGQKAGPKNQNIVKRELFKEVFRRYPKQNFHWLGGSSNLLFEFPFFSADSSGWLQGRKKHQIYSFESETVATRVVKDWSPEMCLSYNVKILSSLEDMYDGFQVDFDVLITA